jgi:hypothetical protein
MKKRAFVRYSKQGRIVPGSLIITNGSYPSGPSTWDEIPADLCCEITTSTTTTSTTSTTSTTTTTTAEPIVCNEYLNDTGETISGLNYTLCDGTVVIDDGVIDGESICIQEGTLSGAGSESLTNTGTCGI